GQLLDADVPKLDACAMPEEADVPARVGDPTRALRPGEVAVRLQHLLVRDVVEVGIDDGRAVQLHGDVAAVGGDLLGIPFAHRLLRPALGRDHAVDGAVVLERLQAG